jgi:TonB family protein
MSRSSDIVYQMQHRRAERKKPKINAKLKKVSIEESQKGGIVAAQENKPPPITVQKTGGRNSVALTFSVGLHVALALLLGFLYIKDQITSESQQLAAAFVPQELPQRERATIKTRPRVRIDTKPQEIDARIQRTVVTNPNIRRTSDDFEVPTAPDTDLGPIGPSLNEAPKVSAIPGALKGPVQPTDTSVTPSFERPSTDSSSIADLSNTTTPSDGPGLSVPDIDTSQPGTSYPKAKYAPEPTYPKNAKRANKEGTVKLEATVGKDGIPKNIVAITSLGFGFEEAAIAALKKWRFIPGKKKGEDVEMRVKLDIVFKLDD